jgi:hypothetical protein
VFAFSNVFHFFAHKLARLCAGRFALTRILSRAFDGVLFWHNKDVSPLAKGLAVKIALNAPMLRDETPDVVLNEQRNRHKTVAISADAKLLFGHAHNCSPHPAHFVNRRTANLAVQLRLGLLPERRLGADSCDRADLVAAGTHLRAAAV